MPSYNSKAVSRVMVRRKGHPLANKRGRVYKHRLVMYEAIGPDPTVCVYCGRRLHWFVPEKDGGYLVVDHINNDPKDNRLENLRPLCRNCNQNRSKGHDCEQCGRRFFRSSAGQTLCSTCKRNRRSK